MIPVALCGATGRMGRMLTHAVQDHPDLQVGGALASNSSRHLGVDVGEVAGCAKTGITVSCDLATALSGVFVAIDFSIPECTMAILDECVNRGVGIAIGTTGFNEDQLSRIRSASNEIPILLSPNMSVGVNVSLKILDLATRALGQEFDVEIYEMHHRHKIDAPSGTALRMGEVIAAARNSELNDVATYGREGLTGEREPQVIGFHSARGGDVVGEHTVSFVGTGERVELTHRAASRANFAAGAMRASVFVADRRQHGQNGMYDMNQVLGL